jgi:hypothetical protein
LPSRLGAPASAGFIRHWRSRSGRALCARSSSCPYLSAASRGRGRGRAGHLGRSDHDLAGLRAARFVHPAGFSSPSRSREQPDNNLGGALTGRTKACLLGLDRYGRGSRRLSPPAGANPSPVARRRLARPGLNTDGCPRAPFPLPGTYPRRSLPMPGAGFRGANVRGGVSRQAIGRMGHADGTPPLPRFYPREPLSTPRAHQTR